MASAGDFVRALNAGDPIGAVTIAWAMVAADTPLRDQWRAVGQFATQVGEGPLAIAALRKFLAVAPHDLDRLLLTAETMATAGRSADAIALATPYLAQFPNDARLHHLIGTAHLERGETAQGLASLDRAVAIWPHSGLSWLAIAGATPYARDDAAYARLRIAAPAFARATPAAQAAYSYALGKAESDRGAHDAAFTAFAAGARLIRPERPYDRAADLAAARALVQGFTPGWLDDASLAPAPDPDAPIFVTGIPRSGTTLVEQILTSHSRVSDGGELNLLATATDTTIGGADIAALRRHLAAAGGPAAAWSPMRARYRHLLTQRVGPDGRAIDKSLNTSRLAQMIRLALPDSPVIWLRRDPADTAWSCYRTFFTQGLGWSFDLADLGHHMAIEDLVFAHWQAVLGDRMLVVSYADLVATPDDGMARILAHCGLAPEPQVARFHETTRAVRTASVAQVRQPIYAHAVGAAGAQGPRLAAFERSYRATRTALGLS